MFYLNTNNEQEATSTQQADSYQTCRTSIDELYQWLDRPVTEEDIRTVDFE